MDNHAIGATMLVAAAVIAVAGIAVMMGALSWFGHLPGDLHYSGRNVKVYVPVTTMVVLSLVLTIALAIGRRF